MIVLRTAWGAASRTAWALLIVASAAMLLVGAIAAVALVMLGASGLAMATVEAINTPLDLLAVIGLLAFGGAMVYHW